MSKTPLTTFPVVVPAAGVGKRMGADRPKQYLLIDGKTILEHTLERLIAHPKIDRIYVAIGAEDDYFNELPIASAPWLTRVEGGKERANSVLSALRQVERDYTSAPWVLVHDAARPCIKLDDLERLLRQYQIGTGGILAAPVKDTMKRGSTELPTRIQRTESRDNLWHALTPQFFPSAELIKALDVGLASAKQITDEASAIELAGGSVDLVQGCASNIKITNPEDLALAEFYLSRE